MRRLLVLVSAVVLLGLGAGCGDSSGGDDAGTAPPAASATSAPASASGGPASGGNTQQVCTQAKALGEEYKKKATDIVSRALAQAAAGDEAKSEQILGEIVPLSKEYKTKFEALAKTADNQQLKDALTVLAKDMDNVEAETAGEATGAAEETLTGICGP